VILRAEGLRVAYGRAIALDGLSFALAGGRCGLLGPNGAGKSSFLRAVLGLVRPAAGRIEALGLDAARRGREIRARVGYMPERDAILPSSNAIASLVHLGALSGMPERLARRRAHETLDFVGLAEERYREVASYSQGMRQRFRLASALVHDPDLVLLDEPTNGLDPAGRREMLDLVRRVGALGIHVLLSTHLLPDVESTCEEVVVLQGGKLRLQGKIEELRRAARRTFAVRLRGDPASFRREAASIGLEVADGDRDGMRVSAPESDGTSLIFRAAARTGSVVTRLSEVRRSLEEVFLESLERREPPPPPRAGS
jgi:ABC-2 type transport system ATP-binding protein